MIIHAENALSSLENLLVAARSLRYPIFLFIDEYDNFANTVMMNIQTDQDKYNALVQDEGILRTVFKAVKASTASSIVDRIFMTGVSPVVMNDLTSGLNIIENISFKKNSMNYADLLKRKYMRSFKRFMLIVGFLPIQ